MKRTFLFFKKDEVVTPGARGVTLVETLVVLALFVLISGFLVSLTIQYNSLYNLGEAQFVTVDDTRTVLNSISVYTVQAYRVAGSHTISGTLYTSGTSTLVVQIPAVSANGDIVASTWDYVAFYKTGNNVYRRVDANANSSRASGLRQLGSAITSLTFTYNNASTTLATQVSVDVQSSSTIGHVAANHHETANLILRNF